jgi:hypothetical protein
VASNASASLRKYCTASPGRLAGICHALHELEQYLAEISEGAAVLKAITEVENMRKLLARASDDFASALGRLMARGATHHDREREWGANILTHAHELRCLRPARASAGDRRAARRPTLIALYKHLRWGGLGYAAISRLVPDDLFFQPPSTVPSKADARKRERYAADRVRKRVQSGEAKSLFPREHLAEKSPKGVSSA